MSLTPARYRNLRRWLLRLNTPPDPKPMFNVPWLHMALYVGVVVLAAGALVLGVIEALVAWAV